MDSELLLTRRRALKLGGGAVLATAAAGLAVGNELSARPRDPRYAGLLRSDYLPHVGRRFTLIGPGGERIAARLLSVRDLPGRQGRALAGSEDAFMLAFHAAADQARPGQAVMRVVRPGGASRALLLVPGRTAPGETVSYSAVINHSTPIRRV